MYSSNEEELPAKILFQAQFSTYLSETIIIVKDLTSLRKVRKEVTKLILKIVKEFKRTNFLFLPPYNAFSLY